MSNYDFSDFDEKKSQSKYDFSDFEKTKTSKIEKPWYEIENPTARNWAKAALNALPVAGGVAGAAAGGLLGGAASIPIGGVGAIPGEVTGAAAGGALGKSLQNIGENYLLGDQQDIKHVLTSPITSAAEMATSEMGGQLLGKGLQAAANSKLAQKASEIVGKGSAKVGELFTGVPEDSILNYAKNSSAIKQLAKESDSQTSVAADSLRDKWSKQILSTRKNLNSQISNALENNKNYVDSKNVIETLEGAKTKIDTDFYPEQIQQIDNLINRVKSKIADGKISVTDLNKTKQFLQDTASSAYRPNAIFPIGGEVEKAAKSGAAVTRNLLNEAEPAIASANSKLARLHEIEDSMNLNMLKDGKPEASIIAAGTGSNVRNANALKELAQSTGGTMYQDAKNLAGMKYFGNPSLSAADSTGKAVGRAGLAAGIGFLTGGPGGAVLAGALTSPMALRTAIDAGKFTTAHLGKLLNNEAGRTMLAKALLPDIKLNSQEAGDVNLESPEINLTKEQKGPDRWSSVGAENLINSGFSQDQIEKLKQSKKGQSILYRASDLKPNSKAMNNLIGELQKMESE